MHIIATYNQHRRGGLGVVAALRQAMSETGMPCLLTSLTTAAGFLGFCAADIQPFREMGVYASVGALMAYILSKMCIRDRTYPRDSVEPRSEVTHALRGVLAQPEYAGFSIHAVGQPILHNDYNELSFKESATFFGLCLLIQMVLLFWLGKGVRGVIGPISVVVLSVIWTLGMIQVLGFTLNLFIILIPTLLICV